MPSIKDLTQEILQQKYVDNKMSTVAIAKEYDVDAKTINRLLRKYGFAIRSRKDSQNLSFEQHGHPRAGKKLEKATKDKISNSVSRSWTEEKKKKQSDDTKLYWTKQSDEYKTSILSKCNVGLRESAKSGSKVEMIIHQVLDQRGLHFLCHEPLLFENRALKVDIFISSLDLIVEIDGPSHVLPIFGQEKLDAQIRADEEKNALAVSKGLKILRFRVLYKNLSKKRLRDIQADFIEALNLCSMSTGVIYFTSGNQEV